MKGLKYILSAAACLLCLAASADDGRMLQKIVDAAAGMKSLECDFVQTVHSPMLREDAVSKGHMSYRSPDKVSWEYTTPISFRLETDGNTTRIFKDGREVDQAAQNGSAQNGSTRMAQGMVKMLLGSIRGTLLSDVKTFDTQITASDGTVTATMTPKKGELRRMYRFMVMTFDSSTLSATRLELHDVSDGVTTIEFINQTIER